MSSRVIAWLIASWSCYLVTLLLVTFQQNGPWTARAITIAIIQAVIGLAGLACMARAVLAARQESRS